MGEREKKKIGARSRFLVLLSRPRLSVIFRTVGVGGLIFIISLGKTYLALVPRESGSEAKDGTNHLIFVLLVRASTEEKISRPGPDMGISEQLGQKELMVEKYETVSTQCPSPPCLPSPDGAADTPDRRGCSVAAAT